MLWGVSADDSCDFLFSLFSLRMVQLVIKKNETQPSLVGVLNVMRKGSVIAVAERNRSG